MTARTGLAALLLSATFIAPARSGDGLRPYLIVGDAIPRPLTDEPGDAVRGRAIVTDRQPILSAEQIEDVVAFLGTLRD